jgi:hypothetical protein
VHGSPAKGMPGLGEITVADGSVVIGTTVAHRTMEGAGLLRAASPIVPAVARHVSNVRITSAT